MAFGGVILGYGSFALTGTPGRNGAQTMDVAMTPIGQAKPVMRYDTELSKQLHLIAISADFDSFIHEHGERPGPDGHFRIAMHLPQPSPAPQRALPCRRSSRWAPRAWTSWTRRRPWVPNPGKTAHRPHGGTVAEGSGERWVELAVTGDQLTAWVSDEDNKPIPAAQLGGKATVLIDGKSQSVAFSPAAANSVTGKLAAPAAGRVTAVLRLGPHSPASRRDQGAPPCRIRK